MTSGLYHHSGRVRSNDVSPSLTLVSEAMTLVTWACFGPSFRSFWNLASASSGPCASTRTYICLIRSCHNLGKTRPSCVLTYLLAILLVSDPACESILFGLLLCKIAVGRSGQTSYIGHCCDVGWILPKEDSLYSTLNCIGHTFGHDVECLSRSHQLGGVGCDLIDL